MCKNLWSNLVRTRSQKAQSLDWRKIEEQSLGKQELECVEENLSDYKANASSWYKIQRERKIALESRHSHENDELDSHNFAKYVNEYKKYQPSTKQGTSFSQSLNYQYSASF